MGKNQLIKYIFLGFIGGFLASLLSLLLFFTVRGMQFLGSDLQFVCNLYGGEMCGIEVVPYMVIYRHLIFGLIGVIFGVTIYIIKNEKKSEILSKKQSKR